MLNKNSCLVALSSKQDWRTANSHRHTIFLSCMWLGGMTRRVATSNAITVLRVDIWLQLSSTCTTGKHTQLLAVEHCALQPLIISTSDWSLPPKLSAALYKPLESNLKLFSIFTMFWYSHLHMQCVWSSMYALSSVWLGAMVWYSMSVLSTV